MMPGGGSDPQPRGRAVGPLSVWLVRWWPAVLLGLATIGAYGVVYYSIGVLIPVISDDTGWRTGVLSGGFSLGTLGQGGLAVVFGHTFDRRGSRPVLLTALAFGAALVFVASFAATPAQFVVAWAVGGAVVGGGLYYNVTMPVAARLYPQHRAGAFSVLTLLGALASPIFYPLAAWFTDIWGWRGGLRALDFLMLLCVAPAAILIRAPRAAISESPEAKAGILTLLRKPAIARIFLVFSLAGFGNSALLLHQVGAMEATGLSLSLASGFAGARGLFQIPGRLLLTPLISRFGVRGSVGGCYAFAVTGSLALVIAVAGFAPLPMAVFFTIVTGMSLGLLSPLNGLLQAEVYGDERLGALNGVAVVVSSIAAAAGAWGAGLLVDWRGSYTEMLAVVSLFQALAVAALVWQGGGRAAQHGDPATAAT